MTTDYLKLADELERWAQLEQSAYRGTQSDLFSEAAQAIRGLVEERDRIFGEFTNSMSKRGGLVISLCKANKQIATITARNERLMPVVTSLASWEITPFIFNPETYAYKYNERFKALVNAARAALKDEGRKNV